MFEQLRDELALETGRAALLRASVDQHQQSLERAKNQHKEKESARRKAKEAVDTNADKGKLAKLPYILVVGDDDVANDTAGLNPRGGEVERDVPIAEFVERLHTEVDSKATSPTI